MGLFSSIHLSFNKCYLHKFAINKIEKNLATTRDRFMQATRLTFNKYTENSSLRSKYYSNLYYYTNFDTFANNEEKKYAGRISIDLRRVVHRTNNRYSNTGS